MTTPSNDKIKEAIETANQIAYQTMKSASDTLQSASYTTNLVGESLKKASVKLVEQSTETVGKFVAPIAENQFFKSVGKVPGFSWLLTALGQVDLEKVKLEIEKLQQEYPQETSEQIAHRIIVDASIQAGGIGLLTNFLPPLALTLFAVDIAAVSVLQAEMIYRIATAYGFSVNDPARRGEVLAIFGLSVGGSGALKVGLGLIELLPVVGAVVGASANATLLYTLGFTACQFYEAKQSRLT